MPDLRGEFIRGWDNGRGVDSGRGILTSQSDDFKSHHHISPNVGSKWTTVQADRKEVATDLPNSKGEYPNSYDYSPAIPTSDTGGAETRPRNIAFQYICLAK
ncbi:Uncharacterised protein [Actinobacillus equuli]|nr:Uncharacterised protein [Actinobacillus equuli]